MGDREKRTSWFESEEECAKAGRQRILQDPRQVETAHRSFLNQTKISLHAGSLASTKADLDAQILQAKRAKGEDDDEHEYEDDDTATAAAHGLSDLTLVHSTYKNARKQGPRKLAHGIQRFANGLADFVSAYAGILDAVRGAGGPYAEVGYQTLSVLLIVFQNKAVHDDKIVQMMDDLKSSFPRLGLWKEIYPTNSIRELVAHAYELVTEFARAATKYFLSFWRRTFMAILPTVYFPVDGLVMPIHKCLAEINAEALFCLHQRNMAIQQDVQRLLDDNKLLLTEQKRAESEADQRRVQDLENTLQTTFDDVDAHVATCKSTLKRVFPNWRHHGPGQRWAAYRQMSPALLRALHGFQQWRQSTTSSLLLLSGGTAHDGRNLPGFPQSWLSPAAIYLYEDAQARQNHEDRQATLVAFFSCQPDGELSRSSPHELLTALAVQLVRCQPHMLRTKDKDLRRRLGPSTPDGRPLHAYISFLQGVLAALEGIETVYVVLDRVDRCQIPINDLLNGLARLVAASEDSSSATTDAVHSVTIKIAVVADMAGGNGFWNTDSMPRSLQRQTEGRLFLPDMLDQRLLTPTERSCHDMPHTWEDGRVVL